MSRMDGQALGRPTKPGRPLGGNPTGQRVQQAARGDGTDTCWTKSSASGATVANRSRAERGRFTPRLPSADRFAARARLNTRATNPWVLTGPSASPGQGFG